VRVNVSNRLPLGAGGRVNVRNRLPARLGEG